MILHKNWGETVRLGNFLFKYASLIGFSKRYKTDLYLPKHYMFDYFENKANVDIGFEPDITLSEPKHSFGFEFWDNYSNEFKNKNVNISLNSFLQSPKYWEDYKEDVFDMLRFSPNILSIIREKYKEALSKKTVGISIRRGDFIGHPIFYQIPIEFYKNALTTYFPDYNEYNIIMFSDDNGYIKSTWKGNNIYYAEGNFTGEDYWQNPMEQLMLGSLCDNFIISNSTFSWWLGYLAVNTKQSDGKVIHCGHNLNMNNSYVRTINSNPEDFYHESWLKFVK